MHYVMQPYRPRRLRPIETETQFIIPPVYEEVDSARRAAEQV